MGFLSHRLTIPEILLAFAKFPCTGIVPFCIPISYLGELWLLPDFWIFANLISGKWYLQVVNLHFFYLSNVDHLSYGLRSICISFSVNCLVIFLVFFSRRSLVIAFPSFRSSLYIRDMNSLSVIKVQVYSLRWLLSYLFVCSFIYLLIYLRSLDAGNTSMSRVAPLPWTDSGHSPHFSVPSFLPLTPLLPPSDLLSVRAQ